MITPERIIEMATDITTLHIIQHKRTQRNYIVVSTQKAKINGEWLNGICYYPENDDVGEWLNGICYYPENDDVQEGEYFWRSVTDFNGFEEKK